MAQDEDMIISEMIAQLEKLKIEHGDEEIRVIADAKPNSYIKLRPNEITHGNINKIEVGYMSFIPELNPENVRWKFIFIYAG